MNRPRFSMGDPISARVSRSPDPRISEHCLRRMAARDCARAKSMTSKRPPKPVDESQSRRCNPLPFVASAAHARIPRTRQSLYGRDGPANQKADAPQATSTYRAALPTTVQPANGQNRIRASPAATTMASPISGTQDSSSAGAP